TKSSELSVLVEFDGSDWSRREWIKVHGSCYYAFIVEKTLIWADRQDPEKRGRGLLWPALNFKPVVDKVGLAAHRLKPIEFVGDRLLTFLDESELRSHTETNLSGQLACRDYPELVRDIKRWTDYQDGQSILLTTPSVLVGYRVEVYRAEGTTQWYTAVIVSYNEATRELTVTDDTVLEPHNEDPSLIQMKILGDRVVDAILKGEDIGIGPRRRSCTQSKDQNNSLSLYTSNTLRNQTPASCITPSRAKTDTKARQTRQRSSQEHNSGATVAESPKEEKKNHQTSNT
ncbi:PREDICTED: probable JmjC domain-containing histone demethylation protein 2C, partial [Priapulus caudatus]|uniref:Probable JmjC domain-containing histone demethylation protein 2C n=1 Tax=Priapulus caudatus TaxID=37621 RepID=A0ABM1F588_PRICU